MVYIGRLLTDDGIFEFKTTQGDRLVYFYFGPGTTILTHGFRKGAKVKTEVTKAKALRAQWEATEEAKRFREELERRRAR